MRSCLDSCMYVGAGFWGGQGPVPASGFLWPGCLQKHTGAWLQLKLH